MGLGVMCEARGPVRAAPHPPPNLLPSLENKPLKKKIKKNKQFPVLEKILKTQWGVAQTLNSFEMLWDQAENGAFCTSLGGWKALT